MGAFKGSISCALYHVDGEPESGFRDDFMERIHEFRFVDLTPDDEDDLRWGWCCAQDMLDTDFTKAKVFQNEYLCLGLRVDRWSLPGALLKARIARREDQKKQEFQKAKLLRSEKEAIREFVSREMKQQMLPAATMVDMVWNIDRREVRFWSQSTGRREQFEELFESTFQLRLVHSNPYVAALHCDLSDDLVGRLADVEYARFTSLG